MNAQYKLGECYHLGKGVVRDEAEAIKWYTLAAEGGNINAKQALQEMGR